MGVTRVNQGYGMKPSYMGGGEMIDPMMGDPLAGMSPEPPAPLGGMESLAPMVEQYLAAPDPSLADQIIQELAASMGIGAPAVDPMGMGGGAEDIPPAGPVGMFEKGGKMISYLKNIKL